MVDVHVPGQREEARKNPPARVLLTSNPVLFQAKVNYCLPASYEFQHVSQQLPIAINLRDCFHLARLLLGQFWDQRANPLNARPVRLEMTPAEVKLAKKRKQLKFLQQMPKVQIRGRGLSLKAEHFLLDQ